jgi:catechol 2,3-dioxygenase-like lactoylglutathione lyase family enzyme
MSRSVSAVSLLVPDYEAGFVFYVGGVGCTLVEDTPLDDGKRWVLVSPDEGAQTRLLLAKAADSAQQASIGNQAGGRVFLFLKTEDFDADHERLTAAGVRFLEAPRDEAYGKVAVFEDPFGNKWDLIQKRS